jgi:uncharacterized membrane protein YhaH (DUF805 family)
MFNFNRRINGLTYYWGMIISFTVASLLSGLSDLTEDGSALAVAAGLTVLAYILVMAFYWICLIRQRANDIGWHPLLVTLLSFSTALFLLLGLIPGNKKRNNFGSVPKRGLKLR